MTENSTYGYCLGTWNDPDIFLVEAFTKFTHESAEKRFMWNFKSDWNHGVDKSSNERLQLSRIYIIHSRYLYLHGPRRQLYIDWVESEKYVYIPVKCILCKISQCEKKLFPQIYPPPNFNVISDQITVTISGVCYFTYKQKWRHTFTNYSDSKSILTRQCQGLSQYST